MNGTRRNAAAPRAEGFALLVLLALVGAGSLGVLLAVQAFLPPLADAAARAQHNVATAADAAQQAFVRAGAFPADLDALAAASGLPPGGGWRNDPYGAAQDLDYGFAGADLRVRSRGPDRTFGTADDVALLAVTEDLVRVRQRARLRLLRAVLLRSPYCSSPLMSAGDRASMRTALRDCAIAKRRWRTADAAERAASTAATTAAAATVAGLRAAYGLAILPAAVTGAGGLMEQLGMPDARATDGLGRPLLGDPVLGVLAAGSDRTGGTDDDM
ncbi:MAG: hypothetical protein FJ265_20575 [Planctomycetes bacterium]|nr:hypothetical protein [Planctomycetota bacterium]